MFHFWCLRRWLEGDLRCPTCRAAISLTAPPVAVPAAAPPVNQSNQRNVAATTTNQSISQALSKARSSAAQNSIQTPVITPPSVLSQASLPVSGLALSSIADSGNDLAMNALPTPLFGKGSPWQLQQAELMFRQSLALQQQIFSVQTHLEQLKAFASTHEAMRMQFLDSIAAMEKLK